ncbi:YchJ family metal-binding protein [Planococcus sp. APC 4015]|nr:YchJ family metal-binding protein [Planococcus sp. APC 4015]
MSFGPGVPPTSAAGFPRPRPLDRCPCGSGRTYDGCCGTVLAGESATTSEQLMRSRYTAFVTGDARHLLATWHPGTRPESIDLDPRVRWQALEIVATDAGGEDDLRGVVEFRAAWRDGAETGVLHERSRFVNRSGAWWYLDGVVSP